MGSGLTTMLKKQSSQMKPQVKISTFSQAKRIADRKSMQAAENFRNQRVSIKMMNRTNKQDDSVNFNQSNGNLRMSNFFGGNDQDLTINNTINQDNYFKILEQDREEEELSPSTKISVKMQLGRTSESKKQKRSSEIGSNYRLSTQSSRASQLFKNNSAKKTVKSPYSGYTNKFVSYNDFKSPTPKIEANRRMSKNKDDLNISYAKSDELNDSFMNKQLKEDNSIIVSLGSVSLSDDINQDDNIVI